MKFEIKIGNKTIDLSGALPLTLGDWKAFEKKKLITKDGEVEIKGASQVCILLLHLAQKVDRTVTEKDIETLPLDDLPKITKWIEKAMKVEEEEDKK